MGCSFCFFFSYHKRKEFSWFCWKAMWRKSFIFFNVKWGKNFKRNDKEKKGSFLFVNHLCQMWYHFLHFLKFDKPFFPNVLFERYICSNFSIWSVWILMSANPVSFCVVVLLFVYFSSWVYIKTTNLVFVLCECQSLTWFCSVYRWRK